MFSMTHLLYLGGSVAFWTTVFLLGHRRTARPELPAMGPVTLIHRVRDGQIVDEDSPVPGVRPFPLAQHPEPLAITGTSAPSVPALPPASRFPMGGRVAAQPMPPASV